MRIGIDISQLAYPNTGVSNYLKSLVLKLLETDSTNEYVLFYCGWKPLSLALRSECTSLNSRVKFKNLKMPLKLLEMIWNQLHMLPLESVVGNVDVFITSDWIEPPAKKAIKATILYDLIVYKYPEQTAFEIITTQKRKLKWVKKETDLIFCISNSTKKDAHEILGIDMNKLHVIYPALTL